MPAPAPSPEAVRRPLLLLLLLGLGGAAKVSSTPRNVLLVVGERAESGTR